MIIMTTYKRAELANRQQATNDFITLQSRLLIFRLLLHESLPSVCITCVIETVVPFRSAKQIINRNDARISEGYAIPTKKNATRLLPHQWRGTYRKDE